MQIIFDIFNTLFFHPIVNLLVFVLRLIEATHIPGALGLSIIIMTVLIRFLLWPFMAQQLKSSQKMNELKPKLDILKDKHKEDKQALAAAQMALYKEHGINPAAGCLPALIQIPILIALYQVILALFNGNTGLDQINKALYLSDWKLNSAPDPYFLGLNLSDKPLTLAQHLFTNPSLPAALILLVPIITAALQLFQSKMIYPKPIKKYPSDSPKEQKEKAKTEDTMAAVQSQMMYMMPIMIGYFAFSFPVGLSIYWNTFTLAGIFQQYKISGWGAATDWLIKLGLKKA